MDPKTLNEVILELKLRLQTKGIISTNVKDYIFKPFYKDAEVSIKSLKHSFEILGFKDKASLLLSRYLIEPRNQSKLGFSDELTASQSSIVSRLSQLVGSYQLYDVRNYLDRCHTTLSPCKDTLKEAI